ncbi:MAG: DUF4271 domain-containing protein [Bacteroidetes bacterium]|nr:DUF4271 domain-containing protein [Bacteroidota bacterium]
MLTTSYSKTETYSVNPIFRDSILRTQIDTARWHAVLQNVGIFNKSSLVFVQQQKANTSSKVYVIFVFVCLILILLTRFIFDNFSYSFLEGLKSAKVFKEHLRSRKYTSLLAILFVYLMNILLFTFLIFIVALYYTKRNFEVFNAEHFLFLLLIFCLFYVIRDAIEFIFNNISNSVNNYKAFFLHNQFTDFLFLICMSIVALVFVYHSTTSFFYMNLFLGIFLSIYIVFNSIKSYQLFEEIHIDYKLHFFLYICAFKILPLLILTRFVWSNISA